MLRLQRLYGKSRNGASVPLCIKLQGAVVCRSQQQPIIQPGDVFPKDSPERLPALDQQPCGPLTSDDLNSGNPQRPVDDTSFGVYLIVALIPLASKYFCSLYDFKLFWNGGKFAVSFDTKSIALAIFCETLFTSQFCNNIFYFLKFCLIF